MDRGKPIHTRYGDHYFRSRTEARWAVFFDNLKVQWEYESEGYDLGVKGCYLPDFKLHLPSGTIIYVEVKPEEWAIGDDDDYDEKLRAFSIELDTRVLVANGAPSVKPYEVIPASPSYTGEDGQPISPMMMAFFIDYADKLMYCDQYWYPQIGLNERTGNHYWLHHRDARSIRKSFGQGLADAVKAAKSARFEFGESPERP